MPKPTNRMIVYCEKISKLSGIALPNGYKTSFRAARKYLDTYSPYVLGYRKSLYKAILAQQAGSGSASAEIAALPVEEPPLSKWDRAAQQLKYLLRILLAGCFLLLISILISRYLAQAKMLAGLFALFGLLLTFFALASGLWCIPLVAMDAIALCIKGLCFYVRVVVLVYCLSKPRWVRSAPLIDSA